VFTQGRRANFAECGRCAGRDGQRGRHLAQDATPDVTNATRRRTYNRYAVPQRQQVRWAPTCSCFEVPTTLVRARALENAVTLAYANHCGSTNGMQFTGLSCITGPDGLDLARAGVNSEVLLVAELPVASSLGALSSQLADLQL
jgi:Carbon-nitrogen hydrolase